jgi:hypothetical protein
MVNASGRFNARANDEKLAAESPKPGRKRITLVGMLFGGRWTTGFRDSGKSLGKGADGWEDMIC